MQVPCVREASKACSLCCQNPFLGHPESRNRPMKTTTDPNNPQQEFVAAVASSVQPNTQFTNHESLPSLAESLSCLNKACPQHIKTSLADQIRSQEYYHLSLSNRVCLDYIGNGLFSYSQQQILPSRASIASTSSPPPIQAYSTDSDVPFFDISYRSVNLGFQLLYGGQGSEFESSMRRRIMRYLNLSEEDYSMVFTANQASAFKLLADSYPFESNQNLLTVYDHKNEAVEAMIESSKKKGTQTMSAKFCWPSLRINSRKLRKMVLNKGNKKKGGLFVFPLQSRMTGVRYSYLWMNMAQENGWNVLLDADALGAKPMDTVGLSIFKPDFLICSFYKVFGEKPSGFSSLFVKKSSISVLIKSFASTGIVSLEPTSGMSRQLTFAEIEIEDEKLTMLLKKDVPTSSSRLISLGELMMKENSEIREAKNSGKMHKELSFSELADLNRTVESKQPGNEKASGNQSSEVECRGLDHADAIGLILTSTRAKYLVNWLVNALLCLQHPHSENGVPLIRIYGPKVRFDRGSAVAFNVFDWKGDKIEPFLVLKLADRNNISLTCGFLQHLWFSDTYKDVKEKILKRDREGGGKPKRAKGEHKKRGRDDVGISVVTVSIALLNNFEDLYRLWAFISRFLDADFVEKERWRYIALNQTTVEV